MSIGLFVSLIVLIVVVLTIAVNDDDNDRADQTTAPAAPLSYYQGDGLVGGGLDQATVPTLKSHTGERQGDGLLNTTGDLSVSRPMAHYHPFAGEGLVGGNLTAGDVLSPTEQARLTQEEMLFLEWNELPGWLAAPEREAVTSYEDMRFLEQNGVYGDGAVAETPKAATVDPYERARFLEMNTVLPGWSEGAKFAGDGQRLTQF